VHQTKIGNGEQRNNLDPMSANHFPVLNIMENKGSWKRVKCMLDDMFKF